MMASKERQSGVWSQFYLFGAVLISLLQLSKALNRPLLLKDSFTFNHPSSFLQLEPEWPLAETREVSFRFRTELPHCLLMYHGLSNLPDDFTHYELYLMLENARLKVIHVYKQDGLSETFYVGKGLNRDKWHSVNLRIEPDTGQLAVSVDSIELSVVLPSLQATPNYTKLAEYSQSSVLFFGGLNPKTPLQHQHYNYVSYIGCLDGIQFKSFSRPRAVTQIVYMSLLEGRCINICDGVLRCHHGGRCVNHYTHTSCDCFGTGFEDERCVKSNLTTVTLRGYSYFSYRLFYWKDRIHSEANRLSFIFKTFIPDSVLIYGAGLHPEYNYMAISILNGVLQFEMDFGDGSFNASLGSSLHDRQWHNFTMHHHGQLVEVILDSKERLELQAPGSHHHLHLDPEVYIGAAPPNAKALKTHNKFVGCLKQLYFNNNNLLQSLEKKETAPIMYHSVFPIEFGCSMIDSIPITFSSVQSRLSLNTDSSQTLNISLQFKTEQRDCVLASGTIKAEHKLGYWQIHLRRSEAFFSIVSPPEDADISWNVKEGKHLSDNRWHSINVTFDKGEAWIQIDGRHASNSINKHSVELKGPFIIGTNVHNYSQGFIGCMKDIYVSKVWVDPRSKVGTEFAFGRVSLDNCQLVDLCENPQVCENGGKCSVEKGEPQCDCTGTGYSGKTCHFSIYKRTCEELYLVGYRKSSVYKIDIDRNGPFPPANVYCEMKAQDGAIATQVENNLPHEMVVRKPEKEGFYVNITYRDFSSEMLQHLIEHSKHCYQHIKYECFKTLLGLRSYTWFQAASGRFLSNIGDVNNTGRCECAINKACADPSKLCNCDSSDEMWRVDEGTFTNPTDLAIIQAYVLPPPNLAEDAEARLSLGSLNCVETDTQQYVITFKTSISYVEVPGWYSGDMQFSFRTSNSKAVLIYQAAVHTAQRYLRVLLTSDYELSFEFTVSGKPQSVKVKSSRKLNSGEWQQVWVDHDTHHMRFTVNLDSEMIDLGEDQEVGPFEGPLYVGGVPNHHAGDSTIKEGFIGCFRGLVINNYVVELFKHLTGRTTAIVTGCQPSCTPNPCRNGATCLEHWGSYECKCVNPIAQSGVNCQNNVNTNGMTFLTQQSYFYNTTEGAQPTPILNQDFLISFRTYEEHGLILYAFDYLNNLVQLYIEDGRKVVFTFNSNRSLVQGYVDHPSISLGLPIQVKVARQKDKTILWVNERSVIIARPMIFIEKYHQQPWLEGQELEIVKPPRGTYPTVPHSELFLGAVGAGTTSTIPGFIGCLQGLKIGDAIFDLDGSAASTKEFIGQLRPSCKMMCDERPCQNEGICVEDWKNNHTSCDCSLTSYTGDVCQKEVGGSFNGNSLVMYHLKNTASASKNKVSVRLTFSTEGISDVRQVLFLVEIDKSTHYVLFALTPEGYLLIEEERETNEVLRKVIKKTTSSFADGQRHWIYYTRKHDTASVVVDGEEHQPTVQSLDPVLSNSLVNEASVVLVGGSPDNHKRLEDYANFRGCISNVIIDLGDDQILPLETAFGYQKGSLEQVKVTGPVNERKCATFISLDQTELPPPVIPPEIQGTKWEQDPLQIAPYKKEFIHEEAKALENLTSTTAKVAIVMGVILGLMLCLLAIYLWRISKKHRHQQLEEEYFYYQEKRRNTPNKAVTFGITTPNINHKPYSSTTEPLVPSEPKVMFQLNDLRHTKEINSSPSRYDKALELHPLNITSSQELQMDPVENTEKLVETAMEDLNTDDGSPDENPEIEDLFDVNDPQFRAPLATTSEVNINRLSQTFS